MNEKEFSEALEHIKENRIHGASELARQTLEIIARSAKETPAVDALTLRSQLLERCQTLASSRPSMAPLANLLRRWQERQSALPVDDPDVYRTGDTDGLEPLSAANLQFQGPFHFYNSSTEYLENLRRNPPQRSGHELLSLSGGDFRIAVFYNYRKLDRTMLLPQSIKRTGVLG